MPSSGSDGKGYDIARKLGHSIVDIFPALVQLMLEGSFKRIDGVKFVGSAEVIYNNKSLPKMGSILFTNYGVSVPLLQITGGQELLHSGNETYLKISIMDKMSKKN